MQLPLLNRDLKRLFCFSLLTLLAKAEAERNSQNDKIGIRYFNEKEGVGGMPDFSMAGHHSVAINITEITSVR